MLTHRNDRIFVRLEKGSFVTFRIFVSALIKTNVGLYWCRFSQVPLYKDVSDDQNVPNWDGN